MTTLQTDLIDIYNSLVVFSDSTVTNFPTPILVHYDTENRLLVFEQSGKTVYLNTPIYYCTNLKDLKKSTYLLPEDYDYLMSTLQELIGSGEMLKPRTCLSPVKYGFDIYSLNLKEIDKGVKVIGNIRFISGKSWLFKFFVRKKYKL